MASSVNQDVGLEACKIASQVDSGSNTYPLKVPMGYFLVMHVDQALGDICKL